ncbi:glycosyltransferase [Lactobacillus acetotolerans]|uniref:Glycosyltransferase n=1 Tax=Lactobacillus acetotolerans TaxID=1600 RepID=A0A0D6A0X9_9LACO|nr:glycosyltransferase [Lactobacillus acetotolerans]KRN37626.1 glycosyl transferase [Lactobacillus acetotolerans DSM 20749 = JCM 3825]QFG50578.1 glycosyltransferase family 8 protein [Lactobacillus acetotolerans]BAQ56477.1 glycosyltransferase [Lactobacillus acetotolerans]GGV12161.1 glycosyl transferase [Lactobacillus acetotolerans DSM 20749 = JCM 3825]
MNILFCGDSNAEDGVLIATLSLLKNSGAEELHIYVLTMYTRNYKKKYHPFSKHAADYIRSLLVKQNPNNTLRLIDCTSLFIEENPAANMKNHFTPYAMLRLFSDQLPQIPHRILYLDDDVIVRRSPKIFYKQDLTNVQLVGILDYWGRFFFHNYHEHKIFDYINSGVLLLNMEEIKETKLFARVRHMMQVKNMFMPDQSAINKLATEKKIAPRRYNEQYKLQPDTVIQHFTTSFRFFPFFRTQTVKPWDVKRIHSVLKLHEYDDLLNLYLKIRHNLRRQ